MTQEEYRRSVIHKVMARLPEITADQAEELVNRASEYFLSVTKRRLMPLSACYLWVDLATRLSGVGSVADGRVTSIKRGDTTIQYSDEGVSDAMSDIESRVLQYRVVRSR